MGINSVDKIIEYVARVAKQPVVVDGNVILPSAITSVKVTDKFFYKDNCIVCGRCCLNENNAWTAEGLERVRQVVIDGVHSVKSRAAINNLCSDALQMDPYIELWEKMQLLVKDINGVDVPFYQYPADTGKDVHRYTYDGRPPDLPRCHWMDLSSPVFQPCTIHLCRSVTCGLPHLRFYHTAKSTTTSLSVSQYGRNHNIGCPIKFEPYRPLDAEHEAGILSRIVWLDRLNACANDMGIETWLPEILHYLRNGKRGQFVVKESCAPKLFTVPDV